MLKLFVKPGESDRPCKLAESVAKASKGAVVTLGEGVFIIEAPIHITRSMTIKGQGADKTVILQRSGQRSLIHRGQGSFLLESLTLRAPQGDILLTCTRSRTEVIDCHLEGGGMGGVGISIDEAGVKLLRTTFKDLEIGVEANQGSRLEAEKAEFTDNRRGIYFRGTAEGKLFDCTFRGCRTGITASGLSRVEVQRNIITYFNIGIACSSQSRSEVSACTFREGTMGTSAVGEANLKVSRCIFKRTRTGIRLNTTGEVGLLENKMEGDGVLVERVAAEAPSPVPDARGPQPKEKKIPHRTEAAIAKLAHIKARQRALALSEVPEQVPRALALSLNKVVTGVDLSVRLGGAFIGVAFFLHLVLHMPMLLVALCGTTGLGLILYSLALFINKEGILTRGLLVEGEITECSSDGVAFSYKTPSGKDCRSMTYGVDKTLKAGLAVGDVLPVLIDPHRPSVAMAPTLDRAVFHPPPAARDTRPEHLDKPDDPPAEPAPMNARIPLKPTLFSVFFSGFFGLLKGHKPIQSGALKVSPEAIVLKDPKGTETARVVWGKPFVVHLSVWLIDDKTAEVGLSLRPTGPGATAGPAITLRTRLPQRTLSRRIPLKKTRDPFITPRAFRQLWPIIDHHRRLHSHSREPLIKL